MPNNIEVWEASIFPSK